MYKELNNCIQLDAKINRSDTYTVLLTNDDNFLVISF